MEITVERGTPQAWLTRPDPTPSLAGTLLPPSAPGTHMPPNLPPPPYRRRKMDHDERHQYIDPRWSIGSVVSVLLAAASLLSVVIGLIWGYSRITYAVETLPAVRTDLQSLHAQQNLNTTSIAVMKADELNTTSRFNEILAQLTVLGGKMDNLQQNKQDKTK